MDLDRNAIPGFALAGAVVRRGFSQRGEKVPGGAVLSAEAFMAIGYAVRRIFVREGRVTPFFVPEAAAPLPPGQPHLIHRGGGRYDVIHGVQLNADVLTKEEAEALAASHAANSQS
jgi:hypothetical protein